MVASFNDHPVLNDRPKLAIETSGICCNSVVQYNSRWLALAVMLYCFMGQIFDP